MVGITACASRAKSIDDVPRSIQHQQKTQREVTRDYSCPGNKLSNFEVTRTSAAQTFVVDENIVTVDVDGYMGTSTNCACR